jgi:hypothetical protein
MFEPTSTYLIIYAPPAIPVEEQWAALALPHTRDALSRNAYALLDPEVWLQLWNPKPSADQAHNLVTRKLTPEQISFVVKTERRATVIEGLLEHNAVPKPELQKLLKLKQLSARVATVELKKEHSNPGTHDEEFITELLRAAGGKELLEALGTDRFGIDEIKQLLSTYNDWAPKPGWTSSILLSRALHAHPELLPVFVDESASMALLQAAAGSQLLSELTDQLSLLNTVLARHDTDRARFILMALGANPRAHRELVEKISIECSRVPEYNSVLSNALKRLENWENAGTVTEPYDEVSDEATLARLVRRASPFSSWNGDSSRPKYFELATLAKNPHLTSEMAIKVYSGLDNYDVYSVLGKDLEAASQALVENFPNLTLTVLEYTPDELDRNYGPSDRGYSYHGSPRDFSQDTVEAIGNRGWDESVAASCWVHQNASDLDRVGWQVLFNLLDSADTKETLGELISAARAIAGSA